MIQRIQTIFLLLAAILLAVSMVIPIAFYSNLIENQQYTITIYKYIQPVNGVNLLPLFILGVAAALIAFIAIFLFKNRKLQSGLSSLNAVVILAYIGFIAYFLYSLKAFGNSDNSVLVSYKIGAILPVIALVFNALAIMRIKKDDKLVKSLDRLR